MKKSFLILILAFFAGWVTAQTRTELRSTDLPKPITDYIAKNFSGYSIGKVFKVDTKGVISYDVCVSKNQDHEKLFFDREGKYLRKESCTNDCCQMPQKK